MSIHDHLSADRVDVPALASAFDGMDHPSRLRAVRDLSRHEQARLFDAAGGVRPIALADLVPEVVPPLTQVIHYGRNSLPVLRIFEKRFCRPGAGTPEVWGYNEHWARWLTGPGYFVARPYGSGEVLVDYLQVPATRPEGWPPVKPNSARLSRFVYHQMQDVLRGVSRHVSVGRATRRGKPMDSWFVLCREDPVPSA